MEIPVAEKEKEIFVLERDQGMSKLVQPDCFIARSHSIANFIQYRNDHSRYPDSKVHGANMGPTWAGSCRPQMGPILAPWILLSG